MSKKLLIIAFAVIPFYINAQELGASDISEQSIKRYKNVINNKRNIVSFIEYSLEEKGLPRHLKNLALIESGFNSEIVSSAGAKGIWQFMSEHASEYGLTDRDRSDIYRSTKAAISSLANLYNKYGNWITVVAAYNCGEGNIQKAMDKANSKRYTDFSKYLPNETINHVQKYLNASYATGEINEVLSDYHGTHLFSVTSGNSYKKFIPEKIDFNLSSTQINSAYSFEVIAKFLNINKKDLLDWNTHLKEELDKSGQGILYLPNEMMASFILNQDEILTQSLNL
ncbi:lytic transglycosylase domain-containing protein [Empedobacter tilapiae]